MGCDLDVPGGMVVREVTGGEGAPLVEFYTGRFTVRYGAIELRALVSVLQAWLREHGEEVDPLDRRSER